MDQTIIGHVFMSYSRKDDAVMLRILMYLREQGINVWVDHEKLNPGTAVWEAKIEKALTGASAVIVILSPDSRNSQWVRREISFAEQYEKPIFPVLVRGDEDTSIPIRLITNQYVDLRQDEELGLNSLCRAISSYLEEVPVREVKTQAEVQRLAAQHIEKERLAREKVPAQQEVARIAVSQKSKPAKSPILIIGIAGVVVVALALCVCGVLTFFPGILGSTEPKNPVTATKETEIIPAATLTQSPAFIPTSTDVPFVEPAQIYTVRLSNEQSYHFLSGSYGQVGEGDFYYLFQNKDYFWANNMPQMGIIDLGDTGNVPLNQIALPVNDYHHSDVEVVVGHTYVSRANANEPGHYIIFRVIALQSSEYVDLEFIYK